MTSGKSPLVDRRSQDPEQAEYWDKLSLAQKFSASSLGKFGYELSFIRYVNDGKMAVLQCDGKIVTIFEDGEIDTSPDIKIR